MKIKNLLTVLILSTVSTVAISAIQTSASFNGFGMTFGQQDNGFGNTQNNENQMDEEYSETELIENGLMMGENYSETELIENEPMMGEDYSETVLEEFADFQVEREQKEMPFENINAITPVQVNSPRRDPHVVEQLIKPKREDFENIDDLLKAISAFNKEKARREKKHKRKAINKKYRKDHKDAIKATQKKYYEDHKDAIKARRRDSYAAKKKEIQEKKPKKPATNDEK